MDNSARIVAEALAPSLLDSLAGLASFVTNYPYTVFSLTMNLPMSKILAFSDLLLSGAEITALKLRLMPLCYDPSTQLCPAIAQCGTVRLLDLWSCKDADQKLIARVLASAALTLEELNLMGIRIDKETLATLGQCARIIRLRLFSCYVYKLDIAWIAGEISKLTLLTSVRSSYAEFGDEGVRVLTEELARLPLLRGLKLTCAELNAGCAKALQPLLRLNRLENLILESNVLGDTGVSAILGQIRRGCRLQKLNLKNTCFGPVGGLALAKAIPNMLNLRSLNIARNKIDDEAAAGIGEAIRDAPSHHIRLGRLNISECKLGPWGITSLFRAIKGFGSDLTTLKMEGNSASELGIKAISECLSGSRGIRLAKLFMDSENITVKEATMLSEMLLSKACTLRTLSMRDNKVGPEMCAKIVDTLLLGVCTMYMLDMGGCAVGNNGAFAVSKLIERRGCRHVDLSFNGIDAEGAAAIADSISACTRGCTQLVLARNPLGNSGTKYLAEHVIRTDMALESLDLKEIGMDSEGAKAIAISLRERKDQGALWKVALIKTECGEEGFKALEELRQLGSWRGHVHDILDY